MNEPKVNLELAKEYGLNKEEYEKILEILGRIPTHTELGIFSVMWSEHCSYKNSIKLLKTLPREGKHLLVEAGEENAGLVDIGDGLAVAFKIESHNHPSAIEPYQGAATGVGGIQRDIFTMGARPIASLNSLRFGNLKDEKVKWLLDGVVRGIGDYGNSFGVPTVGGEVYFEDSYSGNPLVNAMSIGIVEHGKTASAEAKGVGNPVLIVGSTTGRDGIHGATFASEEISEASEAKRPSVQVGDPFTEKLLLEATLEAIATGFVVGIQDMGAAGITCSTSEMSAKGEVGMEIELALVPQRDGEMIPYEIMLSESQERMLVVAEKGKEDEVMDIFKKWDLNAVQIGTVTEDKNVTIRFHGEVIAKVPAWDLVLGGGAPVYERETRKPSYLEETQNFDLNSIPVPKDLNEVLKTLIASPNIASKEWIFEQYDSMVRTNTVVGPGEADAAVIRIKDTNKALAAKTDCNGRFVYLNPRRGGQIAVAESARNVVCSGGHPLAVTNCLNFGNPYKPEIYWQFTEAVTGMGEACRVFETPVTGGNVSFYNENQEGAVYPSPVIGMLGLVDKLEDITTMSFKNEGDVILLLGENKEEIGGSEYLKVIHGKVTGEIPELNLETESKLQKTLLQAIRNGWIESAHDIADGGLAVTLAESCLTGNLGAKVNFEANREDFALFGETQSLVVVSVKKDNLEEVEKFLKNETLAFSKIGEVIQNSLEINDSVSVKVQFLKELYKNSISQKV
ncbi:MAG: phosphoribosylformylglycinamidine synthase subunit PurL [Calditrichaeota bacterium]|nr:MAG: phosphoribosylformylglycinamidine synthase subunit PurL [Calditrichota bacterium]